MVVVRVLFPTGGLKPVEFNEKMVASIPRYEGLDGLIRKYYVLTEDEKKGGGIYLWDSREKAELFYNCLLYTSPSPRDRTRSRMPSSA